MLFSTHPEISGWVFNYYPFGTNNLLLGMDSIFEFSRFSTYYQQISLEHKFRLKIVKFALLLSFIARSM